jgi:hypothetical protein
MVILRTIAEVVVQIPPGPFLSVVQLRYWFKLVLISWRTNPAAIHLSDRKNSDEIFDIAKSYISARPDALDKLKESYLTKMLPHLALRVILQLHY